MIGKPGLRRRLAVPTIILATGLLGAGLLAVGYGGASVARGTSEALGYPTNTVAVTSTPMVAAPTDTATAIPPNATVAPPTATPVLPTGTATPIPPSATPASSTTTATVTATPTPSKAPVAIQLSAKSVQRGDVMTIQVRTLPGLAIKGVVRYPSLNARTAISVHADSRGMASLRISVARSPAQGKSSLAGLVMLTASGRGRLGTASAGFTVYQSVRLTVSASVVSRHGARQLLVSVGVARPAAINVSVLLSRGGHGPIVGQGQAMTRGTIVVRLPLPKVSDSATAHITVTVLTREGVRETNTLAVAVIS